MQTLGVEKGGCGEGWHICAGHQLWEMWSGWDEWDGVRWYSMGWLERVRWEDGRVGGMDETTEMGQVGWVGSSQTALCIPSTP